MSDGPRKGELEAIRQTIRFFEELLRRSPDGIVITDAMQNIVIVNEAFCAFFGRNSRDVIETSLFTWLEQLGEEAPRMWAELEERVRRERAYRDVEFQMQLDDGAARTMPDGVRHLSVNASLLQRVADEEEGVIISIWRDVTERKQAEEKLRNAETNLRNTFDISPGLICIADANTGCFTECNPAVSTILGISVEEFTSRPFMELIHPDDRQRTVDEITAQLEGSTVANFESRCRCKDGSYKWLAWQATAADENGKVHAVATDVTESKLAAEALRESEERFRSLAQTATDAIITINAEGCVHFFNRAAEQVFGYSSAEILNRDVTLLMPPEYKARHKAGLRRYLETRQPVVLGKTVELMGQRKDGSQFPLEFSLSEIRAGEGQMFISIIRDITARKRAEEERKKLIAQLQASLSKVKQLQELLPICANCKRIRDEKGHWHQVEVYIHAHSGVDFTHGICPACVKELYPDLSDEDEAGGIK